MKSKVCLVQQHICTRPCVCGTLICNMYMNWSTYMYCVCVYNCVCAYMILVLLVCAILLRPEMNCAASSTSTPCPWLPSTLRGKGQVARLGPANRHQVEWRAHPFFANQTNSRKTPKGTYNNYTTYWTWLFITFSEIYLQQLLDHITISWIQYQERPSHLQVFPRGHPAKTLTVALTAQTYASIQLDCSQKLEELHPPSSKHLPLVPWKPKDAERYCKQFRFWNWSNSNLRTGRLQIGWWHC